MGAVSVGVGHDIHASVEHGVVHLGHDHLVEGVGRTFGDLRCHLDGAEEGLGIVVLR